LSVTVDPMPHVSLLRHGVFRGRFNQALLKAGFSRGGESFSPGILAPHMPAFYRAKLIEFLAASNDDLLGKLIRAHAEDGFAEQRSDATLTWASDIERMKLALTELIARLPAASEWSVLLEFVIPRKNKRIDAVLLSLETIFLIEQKTGHPGSEATHQVDEYALLLHYFHKPSDRRRIVPLIVSPAGSNDVLSRQQELAFPEGAAYWIAPTRSISWTNLATTLAERHYAESVLPLDPAAWDAGEYFPVPSIIEAARTLQSGLAIREIAHSRAARHDIDNLTGFIQSCVAEAKANHTFTICFVTGVPGSGKTLVGLNLAFSSRAEGDTLSFMSGNGPLVSVLQSLFKDYRQRVEGFRALDAETHAKTLIEDVHLFARTYTKDTPTAVPPNHVVIFDEAQRAWDYEHSYRKFARETSEPEMFLRIMERHHDWAVIIALVGGGQEINDGEAGIAEWGRALAKSQRPWRIMASPDVLIGGDATAGGSLLSDPVAQHLDVVEDHRLHLAVSVRSLKAENYSRWVNAVIAGDAESAAAHSTGGFPVYLTRSLDTLRRSLRNQIIGPSRCGLVASSKAARLRAEGLEPDSSFHANYAWDRWYLAQPSDVRSSSQLEVYASEFEIQGLELDWIGLCWGGDFIWSERNKSWLTRKFRNGNASGWSSINAAAGREYRRNSYRVLLTRARQGLVLFVPCGDASDPTRSPTEFSETARFLQACGAKPVPGEALEVLPTIGLEETLFASEIYTS
jgi:hypothetical protein